MSQTTLTLLVGLASALLLLVWWLFFSRTRLFTRLAATLGLVAVAGTLNAVFEVRGLSGDLVPRIAWRGAASPPATLPSPPAPLPSPTGTPAGRRPDRGCTRRPAEPRPPVPGLPAVPRPQSGRHAARGGPCPGLAEPGAGRPLAAAHRQGLVRLRGGGRPRRDPRAAGREGDGRRLRPRAGDRPLEPRRRGRVRERHGRRRTARDAGHRPGPRLHLRGERRPHRPRPRERTCSLREGRARRERRTAARARGRGLASRRGRRGGRARRRTGRPLARRLRRPDRREAMVRRRRPRRLQLPPRGDARRRAPDRRGVPPQSDGPRHPQRRRAVARPLAGAVREGLPARRPRAATGSSSPWATGSAAGS